MCIIHSKVNCWYGFIFQIFSPKFLVWAFVNTVFHLVQAENPWCRICLFCPHVKLKLVNLDKTRRNTATWEQSSLLTSARINPGLLQVGHSASASQSKKIKVCDDWIFHNPEFHNTVTLTGNIIFWPGSCRVHYISGERTPHGCLACPNRFPKSLGVDSMYIILIWLEVLFLFTFTDSFKYNRYCTVCSSDNVLLLVR